MKDDRSPACDSKTRCPLCLHFSLPTGPGRLLTVLHGGCLGNDALIAVKLCTRSYRSLRSFSPICLWMWLHMSIEVLIKSPHAVYFLHFKTCSNTLLLHQYEFSSLEAGRSDWIAADRDSVDAWRSDVLMWDVWSADGGIQKPQWISGSVHVPPGVSWLVWVC